MSVGFFMEVGKGAKGELRIIKGNQSGLRGAKGEKGEKGKLKVIKGD